MVSKKGNNNSKLILIILGITLFLILIGLLIYIFAFKHWICNNENKCEFTFGLGDFKSNNICKTQCKTKPKVKASLPIKSQKNPRFYCGLIKNNDGTSNNACLPCENADSKKKWFNGKFGFDHSNSKIPCIPFDPGNSECISQKNNLKLKGLESRCFVEK